MRAPVDWYDVGYFNSLSIIERHDIYENAGKGKAGGAKIALPSAELCKPENWGLWRTLEPAEFMRQYGDAELAKYDIPSEDDFARIKMFQGRGEFEAGFDPEALFADDEAEAEADIMEVEAEVAAAVAEEGEGGVPADVVMGANT